MGHEAQCARRLLLTALFEVVTGTLLCFGGVGNGQVQASMLDDTEPEVVDGHSWLRSL